MVNDPKNEEDPEKKEDSSYESTEESTGKASETDDALGESADDVVDADGDTASGDDEIEVASDSSDQSDHIASEVVEAEPDEAPITPERSEPAVTPAPRSGSPWGMVFGGLIAGAIGFLVATFGIPEWIPRPPVESDVATSSINTELAAEVAGVSETLAAQTSRLDALQEQLDAAASATPSGDAMGVDLGPLDASVAQLTAEVSTVSAQLAELNTLLADLDQRVSTLEARPAAGAMVAGDAAMEAQLEAFRSELDGVTAAARAEIDAAQERASQIEAAAAQSAREAVERSALAGIQAALESGSPFVEDLAALNVAPEDLQLVAETGAATLRQLQDDFPPAARVALSSSQSISEEAGAGDRIAAFLRRQTNARSLSPQEGGSVDAVLSRAEAALADGDLSAALNELSALDGPAREAFVNWIERASLRSNAVSAFQSLSTEVN